MESALLVANYSFPIIIDLTTAGSGYTAVGGFFGDISEAAKGQCDVVTGESFYLSPIFKPDGFSGG